MNNKTVHIGFNNAVLTEKIIAIVNPDSNPTRRIINDARNNGKLVDATEGRRTRAVLVMDGGLIVLSALMPETIVARIENDGNPNKDKENA
ncbi:MAG TPA: DUF370 domain-containing protein [Clostridiales bacterium]|nr:DUF370 domain-containing protein [Clostridiales bacterium]